MKDEIILRAVGEILVEKLADCDARIAQMAKSIPQDPVPSIQALAERADAMHNRIEKANDALTEIKDSLPDAAQISDAILKQVAYMLPSPPPDYGDDIVELKALVPAVDLLCKEVDALDSANNDLLELTGERLCKVDKAHDEINARVDGIAKTVAEQLADVLLIKTWAPGIHREGVRVKHNLGDEFIALKDTSAEPDIGHDDWALVTRGTRFRGLLDETKTYSDGDILVKDGALWLHANGRLNLAAMRGEKGNRGEPGPKGAPGADGMDAARIKALVSDALSDVDTRTVDIAGETAEAMFKALTTPPDTASVPIRFFRGEWTNAIQYKAGDAVMYAGHLYLAESASDSKPPSHGNGIWLALTKPAATGVANITARRIDDLNQTAHLSEWTGTQAEYDDIASPDPSTFYTITDAPAPLSNAMLRSALESTSTFAQFKAALLAVL